MTTWTPKAKQVEVWTSPDPLVRVFDPAVFENDPIYDTGSTSGIWNERSRQSEIWTAV